MIKQQQHFHNGALDKKNSNGICGLVRGMKDLWGPTLDKHKKIIATAETLSKSFGFNELQTPIVEQAQLFSSALDSETDIISKEIYAFEDKGGELLALRPEFTACVMRYILSLSSHQVPKGITRLFSYGPLFRYDRPQKGRQRQFSQINLEVFNARSGFYDAELIKLAEQILQNLDITDYTVCLNYLGSTECRRAYKAMLSQYFDRRSTELSDISRERIQTNPMRILDSKDLQDQAVCKDAPKIDSCWNDLDHDKIAEVKDYLEGMGVDYTWDSSLIRGLNYYSGMVFEFQSDRLGAQSSILGGGRYDELYSNMGGKNPGGLCAIGFGAGIERLALLMSDASQQDLLRVCILPISWHENLEAHRIASEMRNKLTGAIIEVLADEWKMSKKLEIAEKFGAIYVVILGSDEVDSQVFKVRNMLTKEEYSLNLNGIMNMLE